MPGLDASPNAERIALLPLDERPVNTQLPRDVAAIVGVQVDVPPPSLLPSFRRPGDLDGLARWLAARSTDPATHSLIASIDMLCYGGLIASRISDEPVVGALSRLELLGEIRANREDLTMSAVSLVTRASDSYSAAEEPDYWSSYGRDIHRLGADTHRRDDRLDVEPVTSLTKVPESVVSDMAGRRLRNHIVNLRTIEMASEGVIDFLAVTMDDSAPYSYGSAEQSWLRHWMRLMPDGHRVLTYPGADEVSAVLVARALAQRFGITATIEVVCPDAHGMDRVAAFENAPLHESVRRQITAAGARTVASGGDVVLIIHAPDVERHDQTAIEPPPPDPAAIRQTVDAVRVGLDGGRRVALADVRYSNGADADLVRALGSAGLLGRLMAFGAWNTAGNTIGGVIATGCAAVVGERSDRLDRRALSRALARRLLDDFAFQSVIRRQCVPELSAGTFPRLPADTAARAEAQVKARLSALLESELPFDNWLLERVTFPWQRGFEIEVELRERVP